MGKLLMVLVYSCRWTDGYCQSLISRQSLGRLREAQRTYTLLRNSRRVRRLRYQSLAIYQRLGILRDGVQALSPSSLHLWIVLAILIVLTGVMIVVWEVRSEEAREADFPIWEALSLRLAD